MKQRPYNRNEEKRKIQEYIENSPVKYYLVAYYTDEVTGEYICIDEMRLTPDKEDFARSYIGCNGFKVFVFYEDGFEEELYHKF